MEMKTRVCCLFLLVFALVVSESCVSDEKYRMKEQESEKLSSQLTALKSEKNALENEKRELRLKVFSLEGEMARLQQDNTNLEEILKAKSGTLNEQIAELRKQNRPWRWKRQKRYLALRPCTKIWCMIWSRR